MRAHVLFTVAATATFSLAMAAAAQTKFPSVLEGHAVLPAMTLVPAPADAPPDLQISGRFAGPPGQRIDTPESVPGISALSDKAAPRPTGISLPFKGQPVQGLSGIKNLKDGTFLTLTDNGFGSKANSPDAMLMFHVVKPDWKAGTVEHVSTTFLSDPDRKVPFRIVNENTPRRYLTGSDFDIESIQPIGDALWFGDEFGPFLIKTDRSGKVLAVFDAKVDGKIVRSPDNPYLVPPGAPGMMKFEVKRSKGFEGMAASPDGKFLYPLLEGPLVGRGDQQLREQGRQDLPAHPGVRCRQGGLHGQELEISTRAAGQRHRRLQPDRCDQRPDHRARRQRGRSGAGLPRRRTQARLLQRAGQVQAHLQDRLRPGRCRRLRQEGGLHRPDGHRRSATSSPARAGGTASSPSRSSPSRMSTSSTPITSSSATTTTCPSRRAARSASPTTTS